jgi:hypothetical protein
MCIGRVPSGDTQRVAGGRDSRSVGCCWKGVDQVNLVEVSKGPTSSLPEGPTLVGLQVIGPSASVDGLGHSGEVDSEETIYEFSLLEGGVSMRRCHQKSVKKRNYLMLIGHQNVSSLQRP